MEDYFSVILQLITNVNRLPNNHMSLLNDVLNGLNDFITVFLMYTYRMSWFSKVCPSIFSHIVNVGYTFIFLKQYMYLHSF
jgi:hypothetical protein